jgi:ATP-binding cassette subfamily B protein
VPAAAERQRIVPEIVQTSAMDCGPASLKAVLEGFGISASYGRLREVCQTEVDGTSIDTIEEVAGQLGLQAEQVMIPQDHLLLPEAKALPALIVVALPNGMTHFVVLWSYWRGWVQVMDPACGRRWMRRESFFRDLYIHTFPVSAADWREWAGSDDFIAPLRVRMQALGLSQEVTTRLIDQALAVAEWRSIARLDATTRMVASLVKTGSVRRGSEASRLVQRFAEAVDEDEEQVPVSFWSVQVPGAVDGEAPLPTEGDQEMLNLHGAVLIRFLGRKAPAAATEEVESEDLLSPELAAVLSETPARPGKELLRMLREDGVLAPLLVTAGLIISAVVILAEVLLFRGMLDISHFLGFGHQRLAAMVAVLILLAGSTLLELPIMSTVFGYARRLETRLRIAFLEKIPRMTDRYFHSRLQSDMAERAHSVHMLRLLPLFGTMLIRAVCMLVATTAGIIWLDPQSAPIAVAVVTISVALPLLAQRFMIERDLRFRTHNGALTRFYLDGLLGLTAIRSHTAEPGVEREHEALLVEWWRAGVGLVRVSTAVEGVVALSGFALAAWLLIDHIGRAGETSMVLLLVYWVLTLPELGQQIAMVIFQYPTLRNVTLRLFEPLGAPDEAVPAPTVNQASQSLAAVSIKIDGVTVRAGGHTILEDIDLELAPGEQIAVVGPSGAGKSSLVGLLLGLHRPALGAVTVDQELLTGEALQQLRRATAWIDPAVQLWNRTFIENLRYGAGEKSAISLSTVLREADLFQVLERLPDGLQTVVGEGGGFVSGGEGQRLRLGRAMIRPGVRLVILDEPFRGLDRRLRRQMLASARELWRQATLICVTHDVGETVGFQRVVVIDEGRVVEDDAPQALRRRPDGFYARLLAAERQVHEQLWESPEWRQLILEDGRVEERLAGARLHHGLRHGEEPRS